jgi:hypothetical protein
MAILDSTGVPLWTLNLPGTASVAAGKAIVVEGIRSGFDRIDVDWIGSTDVATS